MADDTSGRRPVPSRRALVLGGGAVILIAGAGGARHALRPATEGVLITPDEAHDLAAAGEITLVDIRRPDEWSRTGLGQGAEPLDMRRDDFTDALAALVDGDRSRPIALICAGGVRTRIMALRLERAGFTRIIDIPEGMQGSRAGPGWLRRGLPVVPHQ